MQRTTNKTAWALVLLAPLLLGSAVASSSAEGPKEEEGPKCEIASFSVRTALGEPARVEKQEDGGYKATICADADGFRVTASPTEALFNAGYSCELTGIPGGVTKLEEGGSADFEVAIYTVPKGETVDNLVNNKAVCEGGECKKLEAEGIDDLRQKVTVTATRLGADASPDDCKPTDRNAADDCGYSVSLENQRQQAALNPGSGISPPPKPSAFLQGRKGAKSRKGC